MKRDNKIALQILSELEEIGDTTDRSGLEKSDDFPFESVKYHCILLYEGGYITGLCRTMREYQEKDDVIVDVTPFRLTWKGHDLLDSLRNHP